MDPGLFGIVQTGKGDVDILCAVSLRFLVSRPALTAIHDPQRNQILAALSPDELKRLNLVHRSNANGPAAADTKARNGGESSP